MKIELLIPGGIGDAILHIPLIKAIKGKYPTSELDCFGSKKNLEVLRNNPSIDHLLEVKTRLKKKI